MTEGSAPWWSTLLGDPIEAALQPPPPSYEDVHAAVQSILIPPQVPKGLTLHLLQSVNKQFALQHRLGLVPGDVQQTPFGPMPGPGSRFYSLGAVVSHVGTGKWRASGQYDPEHATGKGVLLGDVWGNGRLRIACQLVDARSESAPQWAASATLRGSDYVAVGRAKHGPEVGLSYNQRLAPGSPLMLGGEAMLNVGDLLKSGGGSGRASLDLAVGAALDAGSHFSAMHLASTKAHASGVLSLHHLYRVTERSSIAAKLMTSLGNQKSMVAAGYRMHFRNTLTTLYGTIDSYGSVRQVLEREPVKDLRVTVSLETKLPIYGPPASGEVSTLGFKVSLGGTPPIAAPLSPITMNREIFGAS